MRIGGIVVLVIGIIVGLVALANKYVMNHALYPANHHYDLYVGIAGAVIVVIGIIILAMGGRSSAAS